MRFSNHYLRWLLLPPVVSVLLALLFLAQVVQFSGASAAKTIGLLAILYAGGAGLIVLFLGSPLAVVERALADGGEGLSQPLSDLQVRTTRLSVALWTVGTIIFAVLGTMFVLRSALGFSYFLVGGLIASFPAVAWGYAASKRMLIAAIPPGKGARYDGPELTLGTKIAIVFIGTLLVAAAALIELISSKVSTTLEELAVSSAAEPFQRLTDAADATTKLDGVSDLSAVAIPEGFGLHVINRSGTISSRGETLTEEEVASIRRIKSGDSTSFISPHVCRFIELKSGSIVVLSIPWAPYSRIPQQIATYTSMIIALTMLVFMLAAWTLARDVGDPIRELRELAAQMANGNFESVSRVFSDDEVGKLSDSLGETGATLRRVLSRLGGSGTTITDGVRVITGGTEALLQRSRDQSDATENASLAVENVRGGISSVLMAADGVTDLTQDASSRALEMQASSEEVARSMDYLFQSVEKTSSSTTQMNASMNEMSSRTDVLAGAGDEVLSFVTQMDSTIAELRQSAMSTAEISRQVREDAEAGGAAVGRTVKGITQTWDLTTSTARVLDELQASVGSITQILSVIEEITNRTNLLALNAAIIAAQAGEHGAGFTVVADEIRELAERTRGSTKEISEIIKAVQSGSRQAVAKMREGVQRVEENVELADNASASLGKIVGSASTSYEMATKIAAALDEQAKASRHLHQVTSRMSDHIAEINKATREQARGSQLMAQESERVREIAAQVRKATDEQSQAGRGITTAMEKISEDTRAMRDMLEKQLHETDRIADASRVMLDIAQENDSIAREFTKTVQSLVQSGKDFESEVGRFKV